MAIFSRLTDAAADVSIFARPGDTSGLRPGYQSLVLQLRASFSEETALIVPLPVPPGQGGEVRFVSMEFYLPFFRHVARGFETGNAKKVKRSLNREEAAAPRTVRFALSVPSRQLVVPTLADFGRLLPDHGLPPDALTAEPAHHDGAFAVFVFAAGHRVQIAPLGLTFPTRRPDALYFPTYQSARGRADGTASVDHTLYAQGGELTGWPETAKSAGDFVRCTETEGLVDPGRVMQRQVRYGAFQNADVWLPLS